MCDRQFIVAKTFFLFSMICWMGCFSQSGPSRYALSGSVTHDGQPVDNGEIQFIPDKSEGNVGPSTVVLIENGQFDVQQSVGLIGGAYILMISGYDGIPFEDGEGLNNQGKPLFTDYQLKMNIDLGKKTLLLDVPKE